MRSMFKGHDLIKLLNNNWLFDLTSFVGYYVTEDNYGRLNGRLAFIARYDKDRDKIIFDKLVKVPVKVLKEAEIQICSYISTFEMEIQ